MPFGFEEMDRRDEGEYESFGRCVEVYAIAKRDGRSIPKAFMWEDDLVNIDRVIDMRPANSRKENLPGWWYRCIIKGKVFEIYYDTREGRWFINGV